MATADVFEDLRDGISNRGEGSGVGIGEGRGGPTPEIKLVVSKSLTGRDGSGAVAIGVNTLSDLTSSMTAGESGSIFKLFLKVLRFRSLVLTRRKFQ